MPKLIVSEDGHYIVHTQLGITVTVRRKNPSILPGLHILDGGVFAILPLPPEADCMVVVKSDIEYPTLCRIAVNNIPYVGHNHPDWNDSLDGYVKPSNRILLRTIKAKRFRTVAVRFVRIEQKTPGDPDKGILPTYSRVGKMGGVTFNFH